MADEGSKVCGVFKRFKYLSENQLKQTTAFQKKSEIIVDVVCDNGLRWIKVKTSNPYSMQMQFINNGSSSSSKGKSIVSMADNFIAASNQHQVYFQSPSIKFVFVQGITSDIAYILKQKNISIQGEQIKDDFLYVDDSEDSQQSMNNDDKNEGEDEKACANGSSSNACQQSLDESSVNLGVRSMLTIISALSNGDVNSDFFRELQDSLLSKQQQIIAKMFNKNKEQKTAEKKIANLDFDYCDFPESEILIPSHILKKNNLTKRGYTAGHDTKLTLSVSNRRKRFNEKSYEEQKMLLSMYIDEMQSPVLSEINELIATKKLICCETAWNHFMDIVHLSAGRNEWKRVHLLADKIKIVADKISERTLRLRGKTMSNINKCVFGTGDSLKIITMTAIASFVRKAEQQGVKYFVHVHPVRPLTERYQTEYQRQKEKNDDAVESQKKKIAKENENCLND